MREAGAIEARPSLSDGSRSGHDWPGNDGVPSSGPSHDGQVFDAPVSRGLREGQTTRSAYLCRSGTTIQCGRRCAPPLMPSFGDSHGVCASSNGGDTIPSADVAFLGQLSGIIFMTTYDVVIERDSDTGVFVGYVPGWPGAHSQGADVEDVRGNLREVLAMLLEDGEPDRRRCCARLSPTWARRLALTRRRSEEPPR